MYNNALHSCEYLSLPARTYTLPIESDKKYWINVTRCMDVQYEVVDDETDTVDRLRLWYIATGWYECDAVASKWVMKMVACKNWHDCLKDYCQPRVKESQQEPLGEQCNYS